MLRLNYKRDHSCTLDEESLKLILLSVVREEYMGTLNFMENGDIFKQEYEEIKKIFRNYSKSNANKNQRVRSLSSHPSKLMTPSISRSKLATMLEDMKIDILHSLAMQMDTMQLNMKMEESKKSLVVLCPQCMKKHDKNKCPLDLVEVHGICANKDPTNKFLFLAPYR